MDASKDSGNGGLELQIPAFEVAKYIRVDLMKFHHFILVHNHLKLHQQYLKLFHMSYQCHDDIFSEIKPFL